MLFVGWQIEATGAESVANDAINYVRRGGTLMVYGVYSNEAIVKWSPAKIFGDEIKVSYKITAQNLLFIIALLQIIGSFAQVHCFPRAVAYLESGRINVKGMVRMEHVFIVMIYDLIPLAPGH